MDAGQKANTKRETQPSQQKRRVESAKRLGMKMIRPLCYLIVGLLVVSVGMGAWRYFGSSRQADEGDSISDLEGLDFSASAFESPKGSKQSSSLPIQKSSATGTASERSNSSGANTQNSANGQDRYAAVWLTGTIEEVDRNNPVDSIRRVSGGRSESTNLR